MPAIGHVFRAFGQCLKNAFDGLRHRLAGAFKLTLKETAGRAPAPNALCANTLIDGAASLFSRHPHKPS
jgi:hypothetical protein